jgi:hypothetical protein
MWKTSIMLNQKLCKKIRSPTGANIIHKSHRSGNIYITVLENIAVHSKLNYTAMISAIALNLGRVTYNNAAVHYSLINAYLHKIINQYIFPQRLSVNHNSAKTSDYRMFYYFDIFGQNYGAKPILTCFPIFAPMSL